MCSGCQGIIAQACLWWDSCCAATWTCMCMTFVLENPPWEETWQPCLGEGCMRLNNLSAFMVNRLLKTCTWQDEGDYLPLEAKTPVLQVKSINVSGGMLDGTTDHLAPLFGLWLWPVTNTVLDKHNMRDNTWWQFGNSPKILFLTALTAKLCGEKDFPVLGVGRCGIEWWLSFCDVRLVISWLSLHDYPHLPQLFLLGWSLCHLSSCRGSILSLAPLSASGPSARYSHHCGTRQLVTSCECNQLPLAFPALNLIITWHFKHLLVTSTHGSLCWPLGTELAKCPWFAASWRWESKF